jgi:hypothetical protein
VAADVSASETARGHSAANEVKAAAPPNELGSSEPRAPDAPTPRAAAPQPLDELHAIAEARVLAAQRPRAGLALLLRLRSEHPHGYFVEEREALTVLALAGAGERNQAARQAKLFLRSYPLSPFAERVRRALAP